jgi:hypothetical protein
VDDGGHVAWCTARCPNSRKAACAVSSCG